MRSGTFARLFLGFFLLVNFNGAEAKTALYTYPRPEWIDFDSEIGRDHLEVHRRRWRGRDRHTPRTDLKDGLASHWDRDSNRKGGKLINQ